MTQQFHAGQEVEVCRDIKWKARGRKAKIISEIRTVGHWKVEYRVQFRDGTRAVFDEAHIRAVSDEDAEIFRVGDLHP